MNRGAFLVVVAGVCACHKHEDATPRAEPVATTTTTTAATIGSAEIQHMVALLDSAAAAEPEPDAGSTGQGMSFGHGRLGGNDIHAPSVRQGAVTVRGRLPPEVIQRIVRRSFGRFRSCYENGLKSDPKLAGTVAIQFVIDPKGTVTSATRDPSTTLTDASVVACVTKTFSDLAYPQPEGGIVLVTFPLVFAPSD